MKTGRAKLGRAVAAAAVAVAIPLVALTLVAVLGVPISAGPWRERIAATASEALGRPVALDGPLELVLGWRTALHVGGIRIANPPGFATPDFASLGDARAEVDLVRALQGRLRIRSLEAANARVRLERGADGRGNWTFDALTPTGEAPDADDDDLPDVSVRINRVKLRDIAVEHHDARTSRTRYFDLDQLDAEAVRGQAFKATARGRVEKQFPWVLEVDGAPARALYRGEPWPFELTFEFVGTRLYAAGSANPRGDEADVNFGLGTANLAGVERLLQTELPKVGVTSIAARLTVREGSVALSDIRGVVGASELTGEIALATGGERPKVTGDLAVATFDLRPFLDDPTPADDKPLAYAGRENQTLRLPGLAAADADVRLRIGRWLGLPGDIRDAALHLSIDDGRLVAPLKATVGEVPLAGQLEFDAVAETPGFKLSLGAKRSPLGRLAEVLTGLSGIDGTLGRFALDLGGRGDTLGALVRDLDVKLAVGEAKLTYGNVAGGRPVELVLDALDVLIPRGKRLTGSARGSLAGDRVTARLRGGDLPSMLRTLSAPIELDVRAPGASLDLSGVVAQADATRGTDLSFRLAGQRAGDLARWLGTAPGAAVPLTVSGRARVESDEWRIDNLLAQIGRSDLAIDAQRTGIGKQPIIVASVRSTLLDLPELERVFPGRASGPERRTEIDIPILPRGIDLADADIGVGLQRVVFARGELVNGGFAARLRGGRMEPSPFGATFAGVAFAGTATLDLRTDVPEAAVAMSAERVDLGAMLRNLRIVQDLDATVDTLNVQLIGRGSRLADMLARSSFAAKLVGGTITVRGPGRRALAEIRLKEAIADAPPGKPLAIRLDGVAEETPVAMHVTTGSLAELLASSGFVPFSASAEALGARLALDGRAALPIQQGTADLKLNLSGARLDSLNRLAGTELPPWGPWSIAGPIRVTANAYEMPDLDARVGNSRLGGRARLDVAGERPRIEAAVVAPRVQLDDFELAGWSPFDQRGEPGALSAEALRVKAKGAADRGQSLASPEVLRKLDADINVEVAEVLSGKDRMGDGRLRAQVTSGRVFIGPAEVNIPGGTLRLSLLYEPGADGVRLRGGAFVERFDYGILARRLRPGTEAEGTFSLNFQVGGRAPTIARIMEHANGRIDFAVWPRQFSSDVFDLWAVNVFLAALPELDPGAAPRVNCVVGRFDLSDGKLTHDAVLIDTSRMRVVGSGGVDFRDETLAFRFAPRAKEAQFFSLATPVAVTGTLTNFDVGPSAGDVLATIARFVGSAVVVPFQWLTEGPLPRDGADVCTDPLRAPLRRRSQPQAQEAPAPDAAK